MTDGKKLSERAVAEASEELFSLGLALLDAGRVRQAETGFRKALLLDPSCNEARLHLAHSLHMRKKFDEALSLYDELLSHGWNNAVTLNNRGNTLLLMNRLEEAAESYRSALSLKPDLHDARVALATALQGMGKISEALAACDEALAISPENAEAHWNRALLLLLQGKYREGWKEYEWRWKKRGFTSPAREFGRPQWRGEPVKGKHLLVHAEQGFGDAIHFSRYLPVLADQGARVTFECHQELLNLLNGLDSRISVIRFGSPLPGFDFHIPLLSLPMLFGTEPDNIQADIPYLAPFPAGKDFSPLFSVDGIKAGLCWRGRDYPDPCRSCPPEHLSLLEKPGRITWYSLQHPSTGRLPFRMTDLAPFIRDFNDTALLISHLDLVVTIDSAVAHLAGAMGKPVWLLLPYAPDWRWMLERDDSPWYPTMRIFRQKRRGEWGDVIRRVASLL